MTVPGLVVPRLPDVPTCYQVQRSSLELAALAKAIFALGIGTAAHWQESRGSAAEFIRLALHAHLRAHGSATVAKHFDLTMELAAAPGPYGSSEPGIYYLRLEAESCGYGTFGKALEAMEMIDPRLPVTVYAALQRALHAGGWPYDWRDAAEFTEMLNETYEADEMRELDMEGSLTRTAAVDAAVPDSLKNRKPLPLSTVRTLAAGERPAMRRILDAAIAMHEAGDAYLSAARTWKMPKRRDGGVLDYDSGRPLPCFMAAFRDNDAIVACFDEEYQLESGDGAGPAQLWQFDVGNRRSIARAFEAAALTTRTLAAVARFLGTIPGQRRYTEERPHRGRPLSEILREDMHRLAGHEPQRVRIVA